MALPIGKLTILVGAGIIGSVLAKEGRISNVSDYVSGAFKIFFKQLKRDDSAPSSVSKPRNDTLMAQVNSLRQELQILASSRPIMIVTTSGAGPRRYGGVIVIVLVAGYGYAWWKGWKLPDMMFATKRSLSDACGSIAKQLESVYSSIATTRRNLSSKIDSVDKSLDECKELTSDTQERVSDLQGKTDTFGNDIRSVHHAVRTLETKIWRIEEKQDRTNVGVWKLCDYAWNLENSRTTERIEASPSSSSRLAIDTSMETPSNSSRLALEQPLVTPSRAGSLPPVFPSESIFPDSNNSRPAQQHLHTAVSAPGLQHVNGLSESNNGGSTSSGLFGLRFPTISAPFLSRTRSATNAVLQQTRSGTLQS